MIAAALTLHQLRGLDTRGGVAPASLAVRGAVLPIDTSTGGAVTAAGGLFSVRTRCCEPDGRQGAVESVPVHVTHVSGQEASVCVE